MNTPLTDMIKNFFIYFDPVHFSVRSCSTKPSSDMCINEIIFLIRFYFLLLTGRRILISGCILSIVICLSSKGPSIPNSFNMYSKQVHSFVYIFMNMQRKLLISCKPPRTYELADCYFLWKIGNKRECEDLVVLSL
jgi:hypothetical protein